MLFTSWLLAFTLLPLPYPTDSLEPYIDARTMEIHHDKHHATYVDNLNKAVKGTEWENKSLEELFQAANQLPEAVYNNAGGDWNHTFYWNCLTDSKEKRVMPEALKKRLEENFGSVEKFKEEFRNAGLKRFGSGYAWLIQMKDGSLKIISTANQDNPLMNNAPVQGTPLLVCDVWEHAYYLHYQNRRGDYLENFWNVVNWHAVNERIR